MKTKKIVGLSLFVLMVLNTSVSCVMDRVSLFYIKNCTKDSLLINLSRSDTLDDWDFWGMQDAYVMPRSDTRGKDGAFTRAIIGSLAPPDFMISVDPYICQQYDTYYIYTIKWSVAKNYPMDVIRKKKLYDRQIVSKKDFHDRLLEYRYACPTGVMK